MNSLDIHRVDLAAAKENCLSESEDLFVLYDTPHRVFGSLDLSADSNQVLQIETRYKELLSLANPRSSFINIERLFAVSNHDAELCLRSPAEAGEHPGLSAPTALQALVTLTVLQHSPEILNHYMDLELQARLCGDQSDSDYIQRLRNAVQETECADLLREWRDPTIEVQRLRHELGALQSVLQKSEQQMRESLEELEIYFLKAADLEREKQELADQFNTLTHELDSSRDQLSSSTELVQQQKLQVDELKLEISNLTAQNEHLASQLLTFKDERQQWQIEINKNSEDNAALQERLSHLIHEIEQLKLQEVRLSDLAETRRLQIADMTAHHETLSSQLLSCKDEKGQLQKELNLQVKERAAVEGKLDELLHQHDNLMRDNSGLLTEKDLLQSRLHECEGERGRWNTDVEHKNQQIDQINTTLKQTYEELEYYFLLASSLQGLLDRHQQQGLRSFQLLTRLYSALTTQQDPPP